MESNHDWILLAIAVANAANGYFLYRAKNAITRLEVNTNSLMDALLKRTGEASFAAGSKEAREVGEKRAVDLLASDKAEDIAAKKKGEIMGTLLQEIVYAIKRLLVGKSLEELAEELDKKAAANPEKLDWRNSIVDLLKLTGQDSSLEHRIELAKETGYPGPYDGSAKMNDFLHDKVMERL